MQSDTMDRMNRSIRKPCPHHIAGVACLALLVLSITGCGQPRAVTAWQQQLEQYVSAYGQGNPAVLTRLSERPTRRAFDALGQPSGVITPNRTDANAILVGHASDGDHFWFVFLVGVVKQQGGFMDVNFDRPNVQDIRAAAFCRDDGAFHWIVSEPDEPATEQYLAHQRQQWQRSHPDRDAQDKPHTRFPRPDDRFGLDRTGDTLTITHAATGASWALNLNQSASGDPDPQRVAEAASTGDAD